MNDNKKQLYCLKSSYPFFLPLFPRILCEIYCRTVFSAVKKSMRSFSAVSTAITKLQYYGVQVDRKHETFVSTSGMQQRYKNRSLIDEDSSIHRESDIRYEIAKIEYASRLQMSPTALRHFRTISLCLLIFSLTRSESTVSFNNRFI